MKKFYCDWAPLLWQSACRTGRSALPFRLAEPPWTSSTHAPLNRLLHPELLGQIPFDLPIKYIQSGNELNITSLLNRLHILVSFPSGNGAAFVSVPPRGGTHSFHCCVSFFQQKKKKLIWISLLASDAEHPFICLCVLCMSSLEKCLFRFFAHF